MWPIGPLMHEHRLIERLIALIDNEARRLRAGGSLNTDLLGSAVDFITTYADRCHHGKEEDILFRDLSRVEMAPELQALMNELIEDHKYGRSLVVRLKAARGAFARGDQEAKGEIISCLELISRFYPRHIEKEDKRFFYPCMELFDRAAKDAMLAEFWEFDRKLVHEHYLGVVEKLEDNFAGSRD